MSEDSNLGNNLDSEDEVVAEAPKRRGRPPKKAKAEEKKAAQGMPKRVWIILEDNDEIPPTGLGIGHNGRSYMIRAGEPVNVPEFILEILDNAVMSAPIIDPTTRRVNGFRERLRFPYRRVSAPKE